MANFSPSNLVAGQALFNDKFKSGEWRVPDTAAVKTSEMGEIANPMLKDLRTREDRSVSAYFPIRQAATDGTARAHDHTGARGDSLAESITWTTLSEPFSISIKQADNNVYSFAEMYASSLRNAIYNLLNRIDSYFVTQLIADKTQVNVGGGNGAFDGVTTNDYQLAQALKANWFQNVKAMMEKNLYRGGLIGIVDSPGYVLAQDKAAQGSNNATNTNFQFMGFDAIVPTTRALLDVPTTYTESGLFFESGLVASLPWIPKQNRKALDPALAMSYNGDYGQISIPELGVDFAIHSYAQRADNSAVNGETQDLTIEVEVSTDWGYVSAPLSTFRGANDSVVYSSGVLV
jgi:hypothetical protein